MSRVTPLRAQWSLNPDVYPHFTVSASSFPVIGVSYRHRLAIGSVLWISFLVKATFWHVCQTLRGKLNMMMTALPSLTS